MSRTVCGRCEMDECRCDTVSDLRKAAEAVLERWDSPAWEWMKQGPTAELMATLRTALAAEQPKQEDIEALRRENKRLREVLQAALDGGCSTVHADEDDEIGRHGCCDTLSYKPHEAGCWTLKAKAALRREEPK